MILAVPTETKDINSDVCLVFGRAPYFVVFDSEKNEVKYIENTAITSSGGAGVKAAQIIIDNNIDVLVVPRLGTNAARLLQMSDMKLYKSVKGSCKANIDDAIAGRLDTLTDIQEGFHNHG